MRVHLFLSFAWIVCVCSPALATADETSGFQLPDSRVHMIRSAKLGRSYQIFVALPPAYDATAGTHYPVVLVNDGPYAFPIASQSLAVPMATGAFEPVILVGIGFAEGEEQMASRMRDYTPSVDPDWQELELGNAEEYSQFIAEEVLPFVEALYRADPSRRTLVGHSAGALFGSWVLLNKPEIFDSYILISTAFFYDSGMMFSEEQSYADRHQDLRARVYFAVGSNERPPLTPFQWVDDQIAFVERLTARNYPSLEVRTEVLPEALHETSFPQGFIRGAQWLLGSPADAGERRE